MLTKKCYCKASIHVHSHKVFDLKQAILESYERQSFPVKHLEGSNGRAAHARVKGVPWTPCKGKMYIHRTSEKKQKKNTHSYNLATTSMSECIYINTLGLQEAVWLETIGCGNTPTVQWFPVLEKHAYNFLNSTY